jgi:hypothetical protein
MFPTACGVDQPVWYYNLWTSVPITKGRVDTNKLTVTHLSLPSIYLSRSLSIVPFFPKAARGLSLK